MSTRCLITFSHGEHAVAHIYRHHDGYPSTIRQDLTTFFAEILENVEDTRFDDAAYLAARFVVWQAKYNATTGYDQSAHYLDFHGVGIYTTATISTEYRYVVDCDHVDDTGPKVSLVEGEEEFSEE